MESVGEQTDKDIKINQACICITDRPANSHDSALSHDFFYLFSQPHDMTPNLTVFGEKFWNENTTLLDKNEQLMKKGRAIKW